MLREKGTNKRTNEETTSRSPFTPIHAGIKSRGIQYIIGNTHKTLGPMASLIYDYQESKTKVQCKTRKSKKAIRKIKNNTN
ncbi:hypothetical protein ACE6H2_013595 [Prunus campanulata]